MDVKNVSDNRITNALAITAATVFCRMGRILHVGEGKPAWTLVM